MNTYVNEIQVQKSCFLKYPQLEKQTLTFYYANSGDCTSKKYASMNVYIVQKRIGI